jgi:putative transposase
VTAGTWHKQHHFRTAQRLDLLESQLLELTQQYGWRLEAWAIFSNHYHFVGHSDAHSGPLNALLSNLHVAKASVLNELDGARGRQIWHNFWETRLTFEKSYLARLNYVHQNPVRHGLVKVANQYRWCSAAWLERTATTAQVKTVYSFKTDRLRVIDDYEVLMPTE